MNSEGTCIGKREKHKLEISSKKSSNFSKKKKDFIFIGRQISFKNHF